MKERTFKVDEDFIKKLREVRPRRMDKYPEDYGKLSDKELTRMLKNTEGFEKSIRELETKPRNPFRNRRET